MYKFMWHRNVTGFSCCIKSGRNFGEAFNGVRTIIIQANNSVCQVIFFFPNSMFQQSRWPIFWASLIALTFPYPVYLKFRFYVLSTLRLRNILPWDFLVNFFIYYSFHPHYFLLILILHEIIYISSDTLNG